MYKVIVVVDSAKREKEKERLPVPDTRCQILRNNKKDVRRPPLPESVGRIAQRHSVRRSLDVDRWHEMKGARSA